MTEDEIEEAFAELEQHRFSRRGHGGGGNLHLVLGMHTFRIGDRVRVTDWGDDNDDHDTRSADGSMGIVNEFDMDDPDLPVSVFLYANRIGAPRTLITDFWVKAVEPFGIAPGSNDGPSYSPLIMRRRLTFADPATSKHKRRAR